MKMFWLKNFLLQIVGASIFKKNWSKKHQGRGLKIKIIIAVYWLKNFPSGFSGTYVFLLPMIYFHWSPALDWFFHIDALDQIKCS